MRDELNTLDGYKTRLDELYSFIKKRKEDIKKLEEREDLTYIFDEAINRDMDLVICVY